MFRIDGDISFDNAELVENEKLILNANQKLVTFSFLQYKRPLTKQNPCFIVQINDIREFCNLTHNFYSGIF